MASGLPHGLSARGARAAFEVEAGEGGGDGFDVLRAHSPCSVEPVERGVGGKLAHFHRVLEGLAGAVDARGGRGAGDGNDVEIDVRCQPPVELHFVAAGVQALAEAAEIEEAEVQRLLDLVGEFAGEQDPGDMGFDDPHRACRVIVAGRVVQAADQLGRIAYRFRHRVHACLPIVARLYSCRA